MASALEQARAKYAAPAQGSALEAARAKYTPPADEPGVAETVARHGVQGLTFKFSDELAGVGTAIGDRLASLFTDAPVRKPLGEVYTEGRNEEREALRRSAEANPFAAGASEFVGGMLLPVPGAVAAKGASLGAKALRGAAVGAGAGALTGAGGADELKDVPGDAAVGAAIGGTLGASLPVGGAAVSKGVKLAKAAKGKLAGAAKDKLVDVILDTTPIPPILARPIGNAIKKALGKPKVAKEVAEAFDFAPDVAKRLDAPELAPPVLPPETSPANPGFARPYDAAERARFRAPAPANDSGLDEATAKIAEDLAERERVRRSGPSTEALLRNRIQGEPLPGLESSEAGRNLLSGPKSVNIRPPRLAPEAPPPAPVEAPAPIVEDPLNIRPLLKSAQRDAAELPLPVPTAPSPPAAPAERSMGSQLRSLLGKQVNPVPQEDQSTVDALRNIIGSVSREGNTPNLKHYPVSPQKAFEQYLADLPPAEGVSAKARVEALRALREGVKSGGEPGALVYQAHAAGVKPKDIMGAVGVIPTKAKKPAPKAPAKRIPAVPKDDADLERLLQESVDARS
jgi:hypothetical protein